MDALLQRLAEFVVLLDLGPLAKSAIKAFLVYGAFVLAVFLFERRAGAADAGSAPGTSPRRALHPVLQGRVLQHPDPRGHHQRARLAAGLPAAQPAQRSPLVGGAGTLLGCRETSSPTGGTGCSTPIASSGPSTASHHSQEQMTLFTASRRHPLEHLSMDVLLYFGLFHMVLGHPHPGLDAARRHHHLHRRHPARPAQLAVRAALPACS